TASRDRAAEKTVGGLPAPDDLERAEIGGVDLGQRRVLRGTEVARIRPPLAAGRALLRPEWIDRQRNRGRRRHDGTPAQPTTFHDCTPVRPRYPHERLPFEETPLGELFRALPGCLGRIPFLRAGPGENAGHRDVSLVACVLVNLLVLFLQSNHHRPRTGPRLRIVEGDLPVDVIGADARETLDCLE